MTTPENKVKQAIRRVLDCYPESYVYMSVPYGYGLSTLDFIVCHYGVFVSIEAKRKGGKPTARQKLIIRQIEGAGGKHFTIDGEDKCGPLQEFLEQVKHVAGSYQPQAPLAGGTLFVRSGELVSRRQAIDLWRGGSPAPAARPDRDVLAPPDGVRRTKPDPDAL